MAHVTQIESPQDTLGGERFRPSERVIIGNDKFLELVESRRPKDGSAFDYDGTAVALLNAILAANPSVVIQLDPREFYRPWVQSFYGVEEYTDDETRQYHPPGQRPANPVTNRLVFREPSAEECARPTTHVDASTFYERVGDFMKQNRTSFDEEALELLIAVATSNRGNIIVDLPESERSRPWMQYFLQMPDAEKHVLFVPADTHYGAHAA